MLLGASTCFLGFLVVSLCWFILLPLNSCLTFCSYQVVESKAIVNNLALLFNLQCSLNCNLQICSLICSKFILFLGRNIILAHWSPCLFAFFLCLALFFSHITFIPPHRTPTYHQFGQMLYCDPAISLRVVLLEWFCSDIGFAVIFSPSDTGLFSNTAGHSLHSQRNWSLKISVIHRSRNRKKRTC